MKCRHQGESRTTLACDEAQCPTSSDYSSANGKPSINMSQETDTNATLISCTRSFPTNYNCKNIVRPHRVECGVAFDESASATRLDKVISSLCPPEESSKLGMYAAAVGNQYSSSQLYSHVTDPEPSLSRCCFPSNVNNEYIDIGGLSG
jgi:hypothetical protein